jgi:hypothetical protein
MPQLPTQKNIRGDRRCKALITIEPLHRAPKLPTVTTYILPLP